jgi:hypothetical protein
MAQALAPCVRWRTELVGIDDNEAARHSSVSAGRNVTCFPLATGRRGASARHCSRAWLTVKSR